MKTFEDVVAKHALTYREVNEAIENDLLDWKIKELVITLDKDGDYIELLDPGRSKMAGVEVEFSKGALSENFFLTNYFLICVLRNTSFKGLKQTSSGRYVKTFSKPDELVVVPLKYVNSIGYVKKGNIQSMPKYEERTVNKSPVKGAIIGGAIAGPTGAIIGAAANSGTKTETVQTSPLVDIDEYDLVIDVQDCKPYVLSDRIDVSKIGKTDKTSEVIQSNRKAQEVIERSKTISESEVQEKVRNGKKDFEKQEKKNKWREILAIVAIIALVIEIIYFLSL